MRRIWGNGLCGDAMWGLWHITSTGTFFCSILPLPPQTCWRHLYLEKWHWMLSGSETDNDHRDVGEFNYIIQRKTTFHWHTVSCRGIKQPLSCLMSSYVRIWVSEWSVAMRVSGVKRVRDAPSNRSVVVSYLASWLSDLGRDFTWCLRLFYFCLESVQLRTKPPGQEVTALQLLSVGFGPFWMSDQPGDECCVSPYSMLLFTFDLVRSATMFFINKRMWAFCGLTFTLKWKCYDKSFQPPKSSYCSYKISSVPSNGACWERITEQTFHHRLCQWKLNVWIWKTIATQWCEWLWVEESKAHLSCVHHQQRSKHESIKGKTIAKF